MQYEIIIIGASFAGLATAAQLAGRRVLLVDRHPVGTHQTSACGTLVRTLVSLGVQDAILQVHDRIVVHTPSRTFVIPITEPYCTFDYAKLCRRLREQGDAEQVQAAALSVEGKRVHTSKGTFLGDVIVDASGWHAVLGRGQATGLVSHARLNFGIETTVAHHDEGLHFWYNPTRLGPMTVAWSFPSAAVCRIGVASYQGETRLTENLKSFLAQGEFHRHVLHGGFFPHQLRVPILDELFLVGDAAGQCLGLTGEGIRPALFFGYQLGRQLRQALEGHMTLAEARHCYSRLVESRRPLYQALCLSQRSVPRLPLSWIQGLLAAASQPGLPRRLITRYLLAFSDMGEPHRSVEDAEPAAVA